ncbi:mucin-2 [Musca domestica]|uniref:Mucin-2 n=1 Tax=Musca domestica TaxID=7370 RepID=A0ABM3V4N4_MUSDO|nr:mucin-2 [Musca domestica]
MITDRNKLNFVTIQWLWLLCLILVCSGGLTSVLAHNIAGGAETTQQKQQTPIQAQQQPTQQADTVQQVKLSQQQQLQHQQQQQQSSIQIVQPHVESNGPSQQDVTVRNFSPRMDYNNNEWRPVGRGDPLKNDPTFDYSPPTLDRVRYWADPDKDKEKTEEAAASSNVIDAKLKKANPGKNEILLLGVTGDRIRGAPAAPMQYPSHPHAGQHMMKNAKGETPLLQPKYTSIRRSYYSHQLPTHLMPPPMQPNVPQQASASQAQQSPSQSHMSMGHMMKPQVHGEYRHQMPASNGGHHSYVSSPPMSASMNVHAKPYHMLSSTSSQPWMHAASPASSMVTSMPSHHMANPMGMVHTQHYSAPSHGQVHDAHHQESVSYLTYTRPSMQHTPMAMGGGSHEYYSPNSIRGSASGHKSSSSSSSSRKPWLHDLLKKEVVKTVKPSMAPNSYHSEVSIKPSHSYHIESGMRPHQMDHHFEPLVAANTPVSSTYTPVSFVTTTTTTTTKPVTTPTTNPIPTQAAIYMTSSSSTTPTYVTAPTYPPIYTHTSTSTTQVPRTTTTLSPTRLLIPNTSNLSYRPTVAPIKMTTDSLFSHYNQPEKPLRGPMYLIIEGHSKVKTYGKDELDPHKPKIVPVISSREPVVRRADPNEKRGTPETFQVKHLHTKTTEAMEKITTSTTVKPVTTKTTSSSTTKKPQGTTSKPSTTAVKNSTEKIKPVTTKKPAEATPTKKSVAPNTKPGQTATTTTAKPPTTKATIKPAPKISVTTSPTTASTTTTTKPTTPKPKVEKPPPTKESKTPSKSPVKEEKLSPNNLNVLDAMKKPSLTAPTAMQGLLSFLDSSLESLLKEQKSSSALVNEAQNKPPANGTTKLKSITMNTQEPQIEARVSTKLQAIKAEDYDDYVEDDGKLMKVTTEYLPRETRQIFDYDQLPESRITGNKDNSNYDDEDDLSALGFDDEYEYEEVEEPSGSQLIKRIDALVSSQEEDFTQDDLEALNLGRQQQQQQKAMKA